MKLEFLFAVGFLGKAPPLRAVTHRSVRSPEPSAAQPKVKVIRCIHSYPLP